MSTYNCLLWSNSGFNSINIPDSPTLLMGMTHTTLPVLDLNQERFLSSVRVRASWDTVKNADYCKVGDFYYYVDSVSMDSGDVAFLSLVPDFVTSAGGPGALNYLDGVTSRVHVTDDTYGKYCEDDPYMAPNYKLEVLSNPFDFSSRDNYTFVESTLNLILMGEHYDTDYSEAITAINADDTSYYVTYPKTYPIEGANSNTDYSVQFPAGSGSPTALDSPEGQAIYYLDPSLASFDTVMKGIQHARCLGVEESISGQYTIPAVFVQLASSTASKQVSLTGKTGLLTASNTPFEYATVKNKRVLYGSYTPYTLATAAGNTMKVNAEDIYEGETNPKVRYYADPRRTGKPYYRFNSLNGLSSSTLDFFRNAVGGAEWRSVPMTFTQKSGSAIDTMNFAASMMQHQQAIDQAKANYNAQIEQGVASGLLGMGSSGASLAGTDPSKVSSAGAVGTGINIAGNVLQAAYNVENAGRNYDQYKAKMALQKAIETQAFLANQNVVAPTVNFTAHPDLFNEITHNGCVVYRTIYSSADIARIDKILTMYGYKHCKPLAATDFTNRTYFNYVEANVSVANLPRWWADGIAAQISNGVRVWHVKPNSSYYTNNPVRA